MRLPIDLLAGDPAIRAGLDAGRAVSALERSWSGELAAFQERAVTYHLYR